jgi:hypothetical protein
VGSARSLGGPRVSRCRLLVSGAVSGLTHRDETETKPALLSARRAREAVSLALLRHGPAGRDPLDLAPWKGT